MKPIKKRVFNAQQLRGRYLAHKRWRLRNQLAGKTADGLPRGKRNLTVPGSLEQDYLALRAQMGSTAAEMLTTIGRYG